MATAYVVMPNDYPEAVAITKEAAEAEVIRLKFKHDEPLDERVAYRQRYIRAVEVRVAQ